MRSMIKFCGVDFKNPVVVASATPTRDLERMKLAIDSGAGGIVAKTPSLHQIERLYPSPRFYVMHPDQIRKGGLYSFISTEQLCEHKPEEYLEELKEIRKYADENDCRLIVNVMGGTPDEWKILTEMFAPIGDIVECNLACPYGAELEGEKGSVISSNPELALNTMKTVRSMTDKPLVAKLSIDSGGIEAVSTALAEAGIEGVHLCHRFTCLEIDIETGKPILNGCIAGYGGPWMSPISRKWVAKIASKKMMDVCAGGGIDNWRDAIGHIMAGARQVQMCAAGMLRGYKAYTDAIDGIDKFLIEKGYDSIEDIVGMALTNIKPLHDVPRKDKFQAKAQVYKDDCIGCGFCEEVCFYGAISMNSGIAIIDQNKCDGCGLCAQVCPKECIKMFHNAEEVPVTWKGARGR